jgi:heptosyltransferase-2
MKILLIRFSSLGDIVLTQPLIAQLKESYPRAEIHYLTKTAFAPLVESYFSVNKVLTDYQSLRGLLSIKKNKSDLVIDLHNKFNSWLAKTIIHGKKSFTYNKQRRLRKKIVAHKTNQSIKTTLDLYNSVFRKMKLAYTFRQPCLKTPSASSKLLPRGEKYKVMIFPGATHNTKRIPCHKLISFINNYDHDQTSFYLMGSKDEKNITSKIKEKSKKETFDLAGDFNLVQLVAAISEADIVLSNDSGPMHIAAALGKAQIAFFGSTNLSLGFGPLNKQARVLTYPIECSPCSLHGGKECPLGHFSCMQNISVEAIYANYIDLLKLV